MMDKENKLADIPKTTENKQEINMFGISWRKDKKIYVVRLLLDDGRPLFYKEFPLSRYDNDQNKAIKEAAKWRNKVCRDNLIPCLRIREGIDLGNNKTGVKGVYRKNDREVYVATWYKRRSLQRAQFSENKWGRRLAFYMAWATRIKKQKIFSKEHMEEPLEFTEAYRIVEEYEKNHQQIWEEERKRVDALEGDVLENDN
jgi:hypothetical protein